MQIMLKLSKKLVLYSKKLLKLTCVLQTGFVRVRLNQAKSFFLIKIEKCQAKSVFLFKNLEMSVFVSSNA